MLATITIGGASVIAFQVIWRLIKKLNENGTEKVLDVMIINESSDCCLTDYAKNTATDACNNPNCIIRNIRKVIKCIDEAKYSIDFAMYTFTLNELMLAMMRAQERGVRIRVITDSEMISVTGGKVLQLKNFATEIRVPPLKSSMMHHKFMLIDGPQAVCEILSHTQAGHTKPTAYRSLLLNGSVNWTLQGFGGNFENCIISADNVWTTQLEAEFERMWRVFKSI